MAVGITVRVILVDDAALVRQGIARLLSDEGVKVVAQLPDATGWSRLHKPSGPTP